jgi:hypothetical protein
VCVQNDFFFYFSTKLRGPTFPYRHMINYNRPPLLPDVTIYSLYTLFTVYILISLLYDILSIIYVLYTLYILYILRILYTLYYRVYIYTLCVLYYLVVPSDVRPSGGVGLTSDA